MSKNVKDDIDLQSYRDCVMLFTKFLAKQGMVTLDDSEEVAREALRLAFEHVVQEVGLKDSRPEDFEDPERLAVLARSVALLYPKPGRRRIPPYVTEHVKPADSASPRERVTCGAANLLIDILRQDGMRLKGITPASQ